MALNINATFEGKLTCAFKNDMWDVANFHQSTFESLKIGTLMGSFYPKQKMYEHSKISKSCTLVGCF